MAAQKHRLQFTDANGKKAANAGFQGKLLTDAEKAKNRREQLYAVQDPDPSGYGQDQCRI